MKFPYKRFARGAFPPTIRPIITIKVSHNGQAIRQEALVDSGADICLFDAEIGELLGIPITSGREARLVGATSETAQPYYLHPVTINVGGWDHAIEAGFVPNFKPAFGIVGQVGFFSLFVVKFDYQKEEVEIRRKD
jgi:hypothetical protein